MTVSQEGGDLTLKQAARELGCSKTTLYLMIELGEIQAYKLRGMHYRIRPQSIEDYRAKQCVSLNSEKSGQYTYQAKTAKRGSDIPYVLPTTMTR